MTGVIGLPLSGWFVPSALAVGLGMWGWTQFRRSAGMVTGDGMAVAGIALGVLGLAIGAFQSQVESDDTRHVNIDQVSVGDCLLDVPGFVMIVKPCDEPHDVEVFAVGVVSPDDDLGRLRSVFQYVLDLCEAQAPEFLADSADPEVPLVVIVWSPTEVDRIGPNNYLCTVGREDGQQMTGPLEAQGET